MIKLKDNKTIKAVFTDIDGVWTDGGMYYGPEGEALKKFNTSDSAGVIFLNKLNIPLIVITGEDSKSVKKRMEKLNVSHYFYGIKDKLKTAADFCKQHNISLSAETAFIGNDFNDMNLLKAAAHSGVPVDAPDYVKNCASVVLSKKGGEGVFREYVEYLIQQNNNMQHLINQLTSNDFAKTV